MRVLLALPTAGNPAAPFLQSLGELTLPPEITAFDRLTISGNFIPGQRELAARRALESNADLLIMLDDDMIVPPEAIAAIARAFVGDSRLAVVGALYYSRDGLRPMAANHWTPLDTTAASIPAFGPELVYCDAVGFGCVGIRVDALRGMPQPFYEAQIYVEERAARVRVCNEDYLFCASARRAGWQVGLHAGLRCKHYDRASAIAQPLDWEAADVTAVERMVVAEPGPRYRLVPYDPLLASRGERHQSARLDYIIVE